MTETMIVEKRVAAALRSFAQEWLGSQDVRIHTMEWNKALATAQIRFENEGLESPNIPYQVSVGELFLIQKNDWTGLVVSESIPSEMSEVKIHFWYHLRTTNTRKAEIEFVVCILKTDGTLQFTCESSSRNFRCEFEL